MNDAEPQPTLGGFNCPRYLDEEAKREWRRVVGDLKDAGILARVDRAGLEAYCLAYSLAKMAHKEIIDNGVNITGGKGQVIKNPAAATMNQALIVMHKFMSELGMSATSRTRLKVEQNQDKPTLAEVLFEGVTADE